MEKNNQKFDGLKKHMDAMFSFASKVPYSKDHLLPVIQACKSLIGLNLDHPPLNLLKWLEQYMQAFQPDYQDIDSLSNAVKPEVLSTYHLEKLIDSDNKDESRKYLYNLLQVADHSYIMELLLGRSFHRTNASTLFCWSAYKSIKFMIPKDSIDILLLSLDCLYKSQEGENIEEDNANCFFLYCHSHQIKEREMILSGGIVPSLMSKMMTFQFESNDNTIIPEKLLTCIRNDSEHGVSIYLSGLGIDEISPRCILLLDALLSALRYAPEIDCILDYKKWKKVKIC